MVTIMWKKLLACVGCITIGAGTLHAADVILNEYNAVRASRWLDCDGMNCCCVQPVCNGGNNPGGACLDDGDCSGRFECSADDGATFTGDVCDPANGDSDCAAIDVVWTCNAHTPDGACLCEPPCKQDVVFGRVQGNGGNWIELVVTQNHVDIRRWKLHWTEDRPDDPPEVPPDEGTLMLTEDSLWTDLRAGTIITFTESDAAGGGFDTDTSYDPDAGDWWININTLSSVGAPQTQYVTTVTNVSGDGPGAFSVGNDNWQLTIVDAESNVIFGPCGEGIRFECVGGSLDGETCPEDGVCDGGICEKVGVNSQEIFKLQEDPTPNIDPVTSDYKDGTSSTFGHPNIWRGGDRSQNFTCVRCDDGTFCNGVEECDADGVCRPGVEPCLDREHCDEEGTRCLECVRLRECSDGDRCTEDRCDDGICYSSVIPGCDEARLDADQDGVADALDECPDTPDQESVDDRGCACSQLDEDEDGVDSCTDHCLETPFDEMVDERGCACSQLDDDEDGIDDCLDACADTPSGQTVNVDGCSCLQLDPGGDDDGDGVLNCADHCKGTSPGEGVDAHGCSCMQLDPDRDDDRDGVPDCLDDCAETPPDTDVDDAGCTLEPPDDPPPTTDPPDDPGDNGNDNAVSRNDRRLCGIIGLGGFIYLIAGLLLMRFAGSFRHEGA